MINTTNEGSKLYLYSITSVAILGGLLFGYDTAVISGAEKGLEAFFLSASDFQYNKVMHGITSSSALIGCVLGGAISGIFASRLGRRNSLRLAAVLFFLSALGSYYPEVLFFEYGKPNMDLLIAFNLYRVLGGIGVGLASAVCPMYIAEIAPSNIRGTLVSCNQFAIIFGMLVVYFVNFLIMGDHQNPIILKDAAGVLSVSAESDMWTVYEGWRYMFGSEAFPAAFFGLLLFFVPKTPRYLVLIQQDEKAYSILEKINGKTKAQEILNDIKATAQEKTEKLFTYGVTVIVIGILLSVFQQAIGINAVLYYAPRIFENAGAEGGGMYSFGGRGGKVITVTNLNDRGPGSFREACETGGARIIVFNVAGIIRLESPIIVRAPYVTIAGQTAPGDGVCIAGESFWVDTHDVVVRHMRFRRGETKVWHRDDSFGGNPVGNIMIDHCSCTWGLDENISFYRHMYDPSEGQYESKDLKLPTVNVTIQNTISAKALDTYNHAFGSTLGGENCAFARNLWASNSGRNPSIGWNGIFNFVNNVVFNWVHRSSDGGDYTAMFNMINNYYKPGPATPKDSNVGHRILKPEAGRSKLDHKEYGRVYADGNIMEGYPEITKDNWNGGIQIETQPNTDGYTEYMRSYKPFEMPYINIMGAKDAYDYVLKHVGANIPCRDIVDESIRCLVVRIVMLHCNLNINVIFHSLAVNNLVIKRSLAFIQVSNKLFNPTFIVECMLMDFLFPKIPQLDLQSLGQKCHFTETLL